MCLFGTSTVRIQSVIVEAFYSQHPANGGFSVKKVALAFALVVASLSLAGCFVGKGKAPPPPVITKG